MVLKKRVVGGPAQLNGVDFAGVVSSSGVEETNDAINHQTLAVVLGQLYNLLTYAGEMYKGLGEELAYAGERIDALSTRVQAASDFIPALEEYIGGTDAELFRSNAGAPFSAEMQASAWLLRKETRPPALIEIYETCTPPPKLETLDEYREDGGSCLKDYTNSDFFLEQWLIEQEKKTREAKERRAKNRKNKGKVKNIRKANEVQEVKKLKKTRWNQWGEKIEDDDDTSRIASPSRQGTKAVPQVHATETSVQMTQAPSPRRPPAQSSTSWGNASGSSSSVSTTAAAATSSSGSGSKDNLAVSQASKNKKEQKKLEKEKKKQEKKEKKKPTKKETRKETSVASSQPPPPSPASTPTPTPTSTPTSNPVKQPAVPTSAPSPSAPAPPPPSAPTAPAPPPIPSENAPSAPAPPPPPSEIPLTPQVGAEEKRSGLLQQIQAGKKLKKVEGEQKTKQQPVADDGNINVAAILQRRMAFEYSDDDGSDSGGSEWEDDGGDSDWDG